MSAVVADTHTAVWYLFDSDKLSPGASAALDGAVQAGDPIYLASIFVVEVVYLVEKRRLPEAALDQLTSALADVEASFVVVPLDLQVVQALRQIPREMVPDMPDRIIAATALHLNLPLVTRDRRLQSAGLTTIW